MEPPNTPDASEQIHRRTGPTFYLATRLFPARVREATHVAYAFFRVADDVVDRPDPPSPAVQYADLAEIRAVVLEDAPTQDPVLAAYRDLHAEAGVPDEEVEAFLAAMARDVETYRYPDAQALDAYLRGSAAAVGSIMTHLMDVEDPERAKPHARALGEAFQLTNFLRDVREDVEEYGRIYLPTEARERFGVTEAQIEAGRHDVRFERLMHAELTRAESRYRTGVAGIPLLPADCQFPVLLAAVLYAEYHRLIRARDGDVLSSRPSLGTTRKLRLLARTWFHWRRTDDPEAAFYAASVVDPDGPRARGDVASIERLEAIESKGVHTHAD